ncbi:AMP-binding protein [Nocardioides anomalus]|uniref:AMP-binding protein n=1 Tax=Nocardioides anomalus TaxID=2712223 RepID=A0A6G6WCG0_9ACTN|nr:FadD3 family acyl-CoA ligase [Nocardioides anomalus]QIG43018.1 AMP-binding protein [Nocardioides anomalus]
MLGLSQTLPSLLREAAERFGDHAAYVEGDREISYAELLDLVERTSEAYVARGVRCGDRVVLWGPNSIDWAVAALAVSYAGGVLVPVNSRYVGPEVADVAERTHAALVVVHDGFLGRDQRRELADAGLSADVVTLADLVATARGGEGLRHADVGPDDVADILFTSGTTGRSKGAMSAHRQTIGVARAWAELGGVRQDDRYLAVNPFFHSFGYKVGIVVGLLTGCTLYPVATFDVGATMRLIEAERITVFPGAPTLYQSILAAPDRAEHDLSSLRLAVTGAAVVPVVLIERMRDELGIDQVVTAFGMTEAVVVSMCREGDSAETVATTNGRAIPGMQMRIADNGELLVRGEHVMLGYLDDPEATREAIDADGWLHTGDIGSLDDDGNLRITDRLKDMYISGGFNVYPAEVEQALLRMDGVADVAVVGVPDERLGEVGKAFVVGDVTPEDVVAFARERLANFKVPRLVERVDALPRNLSGKVLKAELRRGP